jgi:3-hydroxybutyryl-CoA dehydrogenase
MSTRVAALPQPAAPTQLERVAVIGAGVMGAGIAQTLALAGLSVALHDRDPAALSAALTRIYSGRHGLRAAVERNLITADQADAARAAIDPASDLATAGSDAELVIEAVTENLAVKIRLFAQLDALVAPGCILASNTSGFPIAALAAATRRPGQVLGWHWASPAPVMRLAEIVTHPQTDPAVVAKVTELARRCGKNPQVVRDEPLHWGFVANRIMAAVWAEADRIVTDGIATAAQVDTLVKDCFRWPAGPFEIRGVGNPEPPTPPVHDERSRLLAAARRLALGASDAPH